ncbi:MAG TPA: lasso peptide biosynthesis B2 protein [Gemmatimonadaceae bacterium]|jgi:hypothetical protein
MDWSNLFNRIRSEIGRYRRALPKLRGLDRADWRELGRAQLALFRAQAAIRGQPTGEMVHDAEPVSIPGVADRLNDARRIALAVNRAATYGLFRPKCLARSMALRQLLNEDGIEEARVRVGVQLTSGRFVAHAWVEYAGQVVGDDPARVAHYAPLGVTVADFE